MSLVLVLVLCYDTLDAVVVRDSFFDVDVAMTQHIFRCRVESRRRLPPVDGSGLDAVVVSLEVETSMLTSMLVTTFTSGRWLRQNVENDSVLFSMST